MLNHFLLFFNSELKANIRDLTEAALDKFVVGNRVVNCRALDIDSPSYKEKKKRKLSFMERIGRHHHQNCIANFLIRMVYTFWIICKRPFQIFEKKVFLPLGPKRGI